MRSTYMFHSRQNYDQNYIRETIHPLVLATDEQYGALINQNHEPRTCHLHVKDVLTKTSNINTYSAYMHLQMFGA